MHKRTIGWKAPVMALLVLILSLQILELYHQTHGGAGQMLPVLMYHHFEETSKEGTVVSSARFQEQVAAMYEAGYHAVTIPQVIDRKDSESFPLPLLPGTQTLPPHSHHKDGFPPHFHTHHSTITNLIPGKIKLFVCNAHNTFPDYLP